MTTILVVDDMAICREPIAEALQRKGYRVVSAGNGVDALSILQEQSVDLVLLDVNMPKLDGLAVLQRMRRNFDLRGIPVILLTDKADRDSITQAARIGVQGYLLKADFSLEELFGRVSACLGEPVAVPAGVRQEDEGPAYAQWRTTTEQAARPSVFVPPAHPLFANRPVRRPAPDAPAPPWHATPVESLADVSPVITKEELIKLVNKGLELRPLGPAVQNVISVSGSSGCSGEDVAKAVATDQALSIRVLKLANSSAYSRGRPVDGVRAAVQRIGVQEIRSLVLTLGVLQQYEGGAKKHMDPRLFWEHSIACGLAATAIAKARGSNQVDQFFLWGMTHDVGRLILLDHVPDAYSGVWDVAERLNLPLETVEAKMMLLDHCHILERALEHWQFPREFIVPVVSHHLSLGGIGRLRPEHREDAMTVALADRIAHALLLGNSGNEIVYPLDDLTDALDLSPSTIAQITGSIPDETHNLKLALLVRANEDLWEEFATQVRQRLGRPIRPVCVSATPETDAYRMFCERLASFSDEDAPSVGIMYVNKPTEQALLANKLLAEDAIAGSTRMPLAIICRTGQVDSGENWLQDRRHHVLKAPVRISQLLAVLQDLLP